MYLIESTPVQILLTHYHDLRVSDTDEYMTPVGKYKDLKELLADFEKRDVRVVNWKSKRSKPRLNYFNTTKAEECDTCLNPTVPEDKTFLEVYNCNIEKPVRKDTMPAEKAVSENLSHT